MHDYDEPFLGAPPAGLDNGVYAPSGGHVLLIGDSSPDLVLDEGTGTIRVLVGVVADHRRRRSLVAMAMGRILDIGGIRIDDPAAVEAFAISLIRAAGSMREAIANPYHPGTPEARKREDGASAGGHPSA